MRNLDPTAVVKLKRADLTGDAFSDMREIQEALLMIPGSSDPVTLRANIVRQAELLVNEMSEELYREFRLRLKGYVADRPTPAARKPYESSEEEKLLTRLLSEDARPENFHPDLWKIKTEYERVVKDPKCTGCAIRQALAVARKSLHEIRASREVVSD